MSANETAEAILIIVKRFAKWLLYGILLIALLLGAVVAFFQVQNYLENRPKLVTNLNGVGLGDKLSDLLFKMPQFVLDKEVTNEEKWGDFYRNKDHFIDIWVKNGRVATISYNCKLELEFTTVNGISCSSSGESIVGKYGNDLRIQCLRDKSDSLSTSYRLYDIPKFGVRHHVLSNRVVGFDSMSTKQLEEATGVNWGVCD